MLEIKPNCEFCDKDLPPDATDAMICTYECTWCKSCVEKIFRNVCPNCGGGLELRPIRPKTERREGVSLNKHPASTKRVHSSYSAEELKAFSKDIRHIEPKNR